MSAPPVFGQETPGVVTSEYNTLAFAIWQILAEVQTITLVKVISCTNNGDVSPVGNVTVQPIINQMTGNRQSVTHGQLSQVPYIRIQGGDNAIIIDPKPGDVGACGFCSRDIAAAKAARGGPVNPASFGLFDWADGIYLGNIFGGTPTRYVRFVDSGIEVVAPDQITLQAPTINIGTSGGAVVNIGTGNTTIDFRLFLGHMHTAGTYAAGSTPVTDDSGQVI